MNRNSSGRPHRRLKTVPVDGGFIVRRQSGLLHGTYDSAAAEAERLTALYPAPPHFVVLKVVGVQQLAAEIADSEPSQKREARRHG